MDKFSHSEYGTNKGSGQSENYRPGLGGPDPRVGHVGPKQPEASIAQQAEMLLNMSDSVVSRVADLVSRLELIPMGKSEGAVPEMPISMKLERAYQNLCSIEAGLSRLGSKLF